ncbi:MAG: fibronectin type III domain-containing protein [Lachnospiraceae bacterium]|nr:fibronectin type III domain-containing protein [Lachnospiraceae bacterium]
MKTVKKLCSLILILALCVCLLPVWQTEAADFSDEPIIYDVTYTGKLPEYRAEDTYLLSVPSSGTVSISGHFVGGGSSYLNIYTIDGAAVKRDIYLDGKYNGVKYEDDVLTIALEPGKYIVKAVNYSEYVQDPYAEYSYTFSFSFDSSTNAKVSSPKKGALKVTAPKGTKIDGFEVRYRISGDKSWKTVTVETKKNLNKTFKKLKAGKNYEVQTRKYVSDEYGYKYYSNWTEIQKVTIKK